MNKPANTDHPVHELIANRWSPCGFAAQQISREEICSLFEAARWSASSYNEQAWSYVVATQDEPAEFEKAISCLVEGNQAWAKAAPVLVICCTSRKFSRNDKPNTAADHDLGLAAANLSLEATSRGIAVHQMIGILPGKARTLFQIPEGVDPLTAMAIGHIAAPDTLPDDLKQRDESPRSRKPLQDFVFGGSWGSTSKIVT